MTSSTDLTVIIPTWNAARVLRDCLASLEAIAPVIIVDGESQDDTRETEHFFYCCLTRGNAKWGGSSLRPARALGPPPP